MVELVALRREQERAAVSGPETDTTFARLLQQCHRAAKARLAAGDTQHAHNEILQARTRRDHQSARSEIDAFLTQLQSSN